MARAAMPHTSGASPVHALADAAPTPFWLDDQQIAGLVAHEGGPGGGYSGLWT
ncbi:FAD-dependent oxidoreductase, partial [Streptomyces sp. TM32]